MRIGNWVEIRSNSTRLKRKVSYAKFKSKRFSTIIYEGGEILGSVAYSKFAMRTRETIPINRALEISKAAADKALKGVNR